jgi:hypothetical protein
MIWLSRFFIKNELPLVRVGNIRVDKILESGFIIDEEWMITCKFQRGSEEIWIKRFGKVGMRH